MIRHGEELVIRGEGMPIRRKGGKGDLYVKFEVEMPGESWASRQDIVGNVSSKRTYTSISVDFGLMEL